MSQGFVGVLVTDLLLEQSESLKDKRRALLRLRSELHRATGAAVAESGSHELLRRAELVVAVVARDAHGVSGLLDTAERVIERGPFATVRIDRVVRSAQELTEEGGSWHV